MRIIQAEQRSPEWYQARLGIPTASEFDMIVDISGKPSRSREKYLYRLAGERVAGMVEETYQNGAMKRGCELEPDARAAYELITDTQVEQVGFCLTDNGRIGCSPDGLVGKDGLLEIKCPMAATHVSYLIHNCLPEEYYQQTQGQLLVTGRKWLDFFSFYPGLKPLLIRVKPDKKFQQALNDELVRFCVELDDVVNKIR